MGKLIFKGLVKLILGFLLIALLIFLSAGSIYYLQGWLFIGILFIPMFIAGVILIIKNPDLLKKRLNAKEEEKTQQLIIKLSALMFIVGFVLAGLSYRYNWTMLPLWVSIVFSVIFFVMYGFYIEVMRENTYLSRTIEVQEDQTVVDTGMYRIVRHPMYSVTLIMFLAITFILGSVVSIPIFLFYPFIIVKRIKNEEKVLEEGLKGYTDYKNKVRYRLVPFIW